MQIPYLSHILRSCVIRFPIFSPAIYIILRECILLYNIVIEIHIEN